jgi:DNA-binding XRE family transcriptional regulator
MPLAFKIGRVFGMPIEHVFQADGIDAPPADALDSGLA